MLEHITNNMDKIVENKLIHNFNTMFDVTWLRSTWHIVHPINYQLQPLCLGIQVRQPQLEAHEKIAVIRIEKEDKPLNVDGYCMDEYLSQRYINPAVIRGHHHLGEIEREMEHYRDWGSFNYFHIIRPDYWIHLKQKTISPLMHVMSTHSAFMQLCRQYYPNYPYPNRCALAHIRMYPHDMFDNFEHEPKPGQHSLRLWLRHFGID